MNAVKPVRLVLQGAQPHHVLDALLRRLHAAVHHRRRGAQPLQVHLAHDAEPLVRGGLAVAVEQLADAVDEDLGAAAGHAVEPGRNQPRHDLGHGQLRHPGDVQDLRRRQRVQPECRVRRLDGAEQVLVPGQRDVGVVAALQQHLVAADADRLVDLGKQLLARQHVAVGTADRAVERAEVAAGHADVRVVDVAVDDVGDDAAPDDGARESRRRGGPAATCSPRGTASAPRRRRSAPRGSTLSAIVATDI